MIDKSDLNELEKESIHHFMIGWLAGKLGVATNQDYNDLIREAEKVAMDAVEKRRVRRNATSPPDA